MYLKLVPLNAPSLITSMGVLFVAKPIYKTTLPSNTELFSLLIVSSLLIPHKILLKSTLFIFMHLVYQFQFFLRHYFCRIAAFLQLIIAFM